MNTSVKIALASLLALSAQYIADIVSLMMTALIAHNASDYTQSSIVAVTNIVITIILFRYCALKWFRLKPSIAGLSINKEGIIISILSCILLLATAFIISLCWVNDYVIVRTEHIGIILFNSFINRGISTAIGEELLFRGFLFSYIMSITKPYKAFAVSILVFVFPHMLVFQPNITTFLILINYIAVSLLLTTLYYKTNSISTPIVFHILYNFILYGIWNVANTGESDSSIFTTVMSEFNSNIFILVFAICQLFITYIIVKLKPKQKKSNILSIKHNKQ